MNMDMEYLPAHGVFLSLKKKMEKMKKKLTITRVDQTTADDFLCLHKVIIKG